MIVQGLFFYFFAAIMVASAVMVVTARNPVHGVLFLILAFFNAAGLFVMLGAEFLAMMLIIVYVGAVAVLFLFVIMMLDIDFAELRSGFVHYLPVGVLVGAVLLGELILVVGGWAASAKILTSTTLPASTVPGLTNTEALGRVLYTDHVYFVEAAGLILMVAMVGAIVLTLRHRESVKRQDIGAQVARSPRGAVRTLAVRPGSSGFPELGEEK